ncbi:hypothetical protein AAFF_G00076230 [Aldrovandia affinis]|uniref:Uncharacterized protein n=1 Tax=Aldrovandia affinis TaxID=143900 RepID=A0AAD7R3P3_9TELE|nr:hypothetical protein AAFF_G00076230 [Aldrovandia affinis]
MAPTPILSEGGHVLLIFKWTSCRRNTSPCMEESERTVPPSSPGPEGPVHLRARRIPHASPGSESIGSSDTRLLSYHLHRPSPSAELGPGAGGTGGPLRA